MSYIPSRVQVFPSLGGKSHTCVHPLIGPHWSGISWGLSSAFPLILFWDVVIVRFHGFHLLCRVSKLGGLSRLSAARTGFLVFEWSLYAVIFGVFLKHLALFKIVSGAM